MSVQLQPEDKQNRAEAKPLLPPNVRLARNIVAGMGMFILLGSVGMLCTNPTKVTDWLCGFSVAWYCFNLVRQVNNGEGGWTDYVAIGRTNLSTRQETEEEDSNG